MFFSETNINCCELLAYVNCRVRVMVFNANVNNVSAISWRSVLLSFYCVIILVLLHILTYPFSCQSILLLPSTGLHSMDYTLGTTL
jgi:hypothetical protein